MKYKKALIIWLLTSISLVLITYVIKDTNWFFYLVLLIFISFTGLTFLKTKSAKLVSYCILSGLIFSILSTVSLLDNYIRSQIENQDGIAITNTLSYLYLGEDGWSKELFQSAYELSFAISIFLFIAYILSLFFIVYSDKNL